MFLLYLLNRDIIFILWTNMKRNIYQLYCRKRISDTIDDFTHFFLCTQTFFYQNIFNLTICKHICLIEYITLVININNVSKNTYIILNYAYTNNTWEISIIFVIPNIFYLFHSTHILHYENKLFYIKYQTKYPRISTLHSFHLQTHITCTFVPQKHTYEINSHCVNPAQRFVNPKRKKKQINK